MLGVLTSTQAHKHASNYNSKFNMLLYFVKAFIPLGEDFTKEASTSDGKKLLLA